MLPTLELGLYFPRFKEKKELLVIFQKLLARLNVIIASPEENF
jgi:hypothetical protein